MRDDDGLRIRHMLDAANEALTFARGRTRADLDSDRMLALALVKCIEIIGEVAARVTAAGRQALPTIPWANIVAMRNRLIHAYFDIDMDRVWDTLVDDLPPLVSALRAVQTEDEPAQ